MVDYVVHGNVAVLEVNNPPVNALSTAVRAGIVKGIKDANADEAVQAIVLCGNGRTFPAGADIKEFAGRRKQAGAAGLQGDSRVDTLIENSCKPVISAIHGTCLGGGLEMALSSHYRVALPSARLGLPEVLIGILPGLGGTQRLPRLIGLAKAIDIISTGRHVKAKEALLSGLLDKIVDAGDNIKEMGIKFANSVIGKAVRVTSKLAVPDADNYENIVSEALKKAKRRYHGLQAPISCIHAVAASVTSPSFEVGLIKEKNLFRDLFTSDQAVGLQYAFFAQRATPKWEVPGGVSYKTVKPLPFVTGAVIGGGTMGSGIAMVMLNSGMPVTLVEQNQKFLDKSIAMVKKLYEGSVKLGNMTSDQAELNLSRLSATTSYEDLADVDLVVEAVYENMALKKNIFTKLNSVCKPSALLCSNTSTLSIDEIASVTSHPDKVIGAHFFSPAYYMKLLEVVRGEKTSPESIATAFSYATKIGKVPVLVGNCYGFVANRMMGPYTSEARFMVEEGLLPHQVDGVIEEFGFRMGPFKVADLSGLDIGVSAKKEMCKRNGIPYDPRSLTLGGARNTPIVDILVEMGRLGRKTGKGWYKYVEAGAKVPEVDPFVTEVIESFCKEHGIHRRQIPKQEVRERCLYAMINEAFKILEDGIAAKPEDVDTIWNLGYGWPRQTGGPMFHASKVGLKEVYDKVVQYHKLYPNCLHWKPSSLLHKIATTSPNAPMSTWTRQHSKL